MESKNTTPLLQLVQVSRTCFINLADVSRTFEAKRYNDDIDAYEHGIRLYFVSGQHAEYWGTQAETVIAALAAASPAQPAAPVRPHYLQTPGASRRVYLKAQNEMFGATRNAGLDPDDRDAMIAAIEKLLGISITSRTQMTPGEMRRVIAAAANGKLAAAWPEQEMKVPLPFPYYSDQKFKHAA
ncbi:MAG TPA: hypothetical protein VF719_07185 [Abditibacteriaceae bacterium]|jgi:hypothetical protein